MIALTRPIPVDVPLPTGTEMFLPGCRPVVRDRDGWGGIVLTIPEGPEGIEGCVLVLVTLPIRHFEVGQVMRVHTSHLTIETYL